jgi:NADPH-dependent ferric siderophore reductase
MLRQSLRQVQASGGRPVVWIVAEEQAAVFIRALFDEMDVGRERITVAHVPWTGKKA